MRPSPEGTYESLSVFADVKDQNGPDDIVELRVVQEAQRFIWKLNESNWTKRTDGGDTWIGAADLVSYDYAALPRGEYRVEAVDAAGDIAERSFTLSGGFPERPGPQVSYSEGKLRVASAWPETLLLGFDEAGFLVASHPAPSAEAGLAEVFGGDAAKIREVAAYGYDPAVQAGYYSPRIETR